MKDINKFRRQLGVLISQGRIPGQKLDYIMEIMESHATNFLDELFHNAVLENDPATTSALLGLGFFYDSKIEEAWFKKITDKNLENDPYLIGVGYNHNFEDYQISLALTLTESNKFNEEPYILGLNYIIDYLHNDIKKTHNFTTNQIKDFKRIFTNNLELHKKNHTEEFKNTIETLCLSYEAYIKSDIKYLNPETNREYIHLAGWMIKTVTCSKIWMDYK